jgi:hypothetical protein
MFNIITRFSRKDKIERTINSVNQQTFSNINHYITYENDKDIDFLKSIKTKVPTHFIKVPKYNKIDNIGIYYEYHDIHTNYLDWDLEKSKFKFYHGNPPDEKSDEDRIIYDSQIRYEKDGFWCETLNYSVRMVCRHFPYNLYLKIVEGYLEDGWIIYLDDDDFFMSNDSLEKLNNHIENNDEDTIHIFKILTAFDGVTMPNEKYFLFMKTGHPIVHKECGGSCFTFHTKYKQYANWDEWRLSDVRVIKSLERVIPKKNFIDEIIINTPND